MFRLQHVFGTTTPDLAKMRREENERGSYGVDHKAFSYHGEMQTHAWPLPHCGKNACRGYVQSTYYVVLVRV